MFTGGLIILIGLSFLARQFGWNWVAPADLWRLWPVFLILLGLSIASRGHAFGTVLNLLLGLGIVALVAVTLIFRPATPAVTTEPFSITRDTGATAATVRMNLGAAKVTLAGGSSVLFDGRLESNVTSLTTKNVTIDGTQDVTVSMENPGGSWPWWGGQKNELVGKLTGEVPLTLEVNSGATDLDLDLSSVQAREVVVSTGASSVDLKLGDRLESSTATISAGASSITVRVPKTLGVALKLDAAVSGKTLPDFTDKGDHRYESTNYAAAAKHLDLRISTGASGIEIVWYE